MGGRGVGGLGAGLPPGGGRAGGGGGGGVGGVGVRGIGELVAVLPPAAAGPARAVAEGLAELAGLRHAALGAEEVRALGEVWERFTGQAGSGRLGVLAAIDARDDVIPKARVGD